MRPYFAIILDSFHAAFASRVLWIVLAFILLFLIALAPIGYHEVFTVEFTPADIHSPDRLTGLLAAALTNDRPSAARRVALALPEDLRAEILAAAEQDEEGPGRYRYADVFNTLLSSDRWHDAELWRATPRLGELRELDERSEDQMDQRLRMRRARLRLEAALPGAFRPRPERSLMITYAGLETPQALPIRRQQFADMLNQFVFPSVLYYLLGVGAVFVGVLVTAPIIPEMLQPGSLHLLLSKPISRPALYLSKFVGGCAFVLLCVTLLVCGLWLIAGWRLEVWNHRLLYCIPVLVFLFAVYYSVSALAALRWRSAIVSVVLTIVFWFVCFLVGTTASLFDGLVTGPATVNGLAVADDVVVAATASGDLLRLGPSQPAYEPLVATDFGQGHRMLGPVRLSDGRVVAARVSDHQFHFFGSEDVHLIILDPENQWTQMLGIQLPAGVTEIQPAADGGLFALGTGGVFYAAGDALLADADSEDSPPAIAGGLFGGIERLLGNVVHGFTPVAPESLAVSPPSSFATIPGSSDLVVYTRGRLLRLSRQDEQEWSVTAETMTAGDHTLSTQIAATARHAVIARQGEPLRFFDLATLQVHGEIPFPDSVSVAAMHPSPDGRMIAVSLSDRRVALIHDGSEPQMTFPSYPHQGHISAAAWDNAGTLWMAHHVDRLVAVNPSSGALQADRRPERDLWRSIDAWVVTPLRSIVPQTGEISETMTAIITGRKDLEIEAGTEVQREQLNVVRPLATCGAFIAVMLLLGCLYIDRQDF